MKICLHVCVCIFLHVHVRLYCKTTCAYSNVFVYKYLRACICTYISVWHAWMYVCICICVYVSACISIYIYTHTWRTSICCRRMPWFKWQYQRPLALIWATSPCMPVSFSGSAKLNKITCRICNEINIWYLKQVYLYIHGGYYFIQNVLHRMCNLQYLTWGR